jgi:hypothetical protein
MKDKVVRVGSAATREFIVLISPSPLKSPLKVKNKDMPA